MSIGDSTSDISRCDNEKRGGLNKPMGEAEGAGAALGAVAVVKAVGVHAAVFVPSFAGDCTPAIRFDSGLEYVITGLSAKGSRAGALTRVSLEGMRTSGRRQGDSSSAGEGQEWSGGVR
jgi:hypothetical protein